MAAYDPEVIQGYLAIVDAPPTTTAKGKAFEDLACYLLNGIPWDYDHCTQRDEQLRD